MVIVFLLVTLGNVFYALRGPHSPIRAMLYIVVTVITLILMYAAFYMKLGLLDTQRKLVSHSFYLSFYFSIIMCTSVGYGDLAPLAATGGRLIAASEAFFGYLYMGIIVGLSTQFYARGRANNITRA